MSQIKVDKSLIKLKGQVGPHLSHQSRSFEKHLTRFHSSLGNTSTGTIELRLTHKISSLRTRGVRLVLPAIRWHVNKLAVMTLQFVRTAEVHVEPESRSDSGRRLCLFAYVTREGWDRCPMWPSYRYTHLADLHTYAPTAGVPSARASHTMRLRHFTLPGGRIRSSG